MRTFLIALVAALVGAAAAGVVQQMRLNDALDREDFAETQADAVRDALERSHEDVHELERRIRRLRSEMSQLEADADEPHLTPTGAPLEDGRHAVFLDGLDNDSLFFDVIQWLSGEAANEAAVEDGAIEEGDSVPNDYYIRNENPQLRTLNVASGITVVLSTWDCQNIPSEKSVTFARFVEIFNSPGRCGQNVPRSPYWLTVEDGVIVAIEEQYRP